MISRFFIDRPIFASVLSIVITLGGAVSLFYALPVALYPPISPPVVQVDGAYPGASAEVVEKTVAAPIEQQVNGVENMLYMSSQCTNDGSYNLTVTFKHGVDLNMAQVLVQNRVALALPLLPDVLKQTGVTTRKKAPDILMVVALTSPTRQFDQLYLSTYAALQIKDELGRLPGVGDVTIFGQRDYSMRIWVDPEKLASRNMTALDVVNAIREQNVQVATGQIGQQPVPRGQERQLTLSTLGRLTEPEQFGEIIVKVDQGLPAPPPLATAATATSRGAAAAPLTPLRNSLPGLGAPTAGMMGTATTVSSPTPILSGPATSLSSPTTVSGGVTFGFPERSQITVTNSLIASSNSVIAGFQPMSISPIGSGFSGGGATGFSGTTASSTGGGLTALLTTSGMSSMAGGGVASGATTTPLGSAQPTARVVRLRDVARIELGAKNEDISSKVNGNPCVSMAVFQLPDANALDAAVIVKAKMAELAKDFPPGMAYEIRYDTTPFITESIMEVVKTLIEAIVLVAIVVLLFLQNWRSALIPLVAVPVAIVGTFAVLAALGFSLNNLTLFGLVLAIGIVVDDAIVVVEAVEHHIEHGMAPRDATVLAMDQVSGPVIAIGLVLTAVFVPCAFISGIVGQFFRQFALTIATSTVISAFVSLTLSPALAALLLRPRPAGGQREDPLPKAAYALAGALAGWLWLAPLAVFRLGAWVPAVPASAAELGAVALGLIVGWAVARPLNWLLGGSFAAFNSAFRAATGAYTRGVGMLLKASVLVLIGYAGLLYATYDGYQRTPKGFIPSQDMGYLLVNVQLPDAASSERTQKVMDQLEVIAHQIPGIRHTQATTGQSLLLSAFGSNFGTMFIMLDDFSRRRDPKLRGEAIAAELRQRAATQVYDAQVSVFGPPPVRGVGRAGGFKIMIEDRGGGAGLLTLQGQADNLTERANQQPDLVGLVSVFRANVPTLFAEVDRKSCLSKGVTLGDLSATSQIYLGSLYVNDINRFGRTWQVIVQADAKYRNQPEAIKQLKVRNSGGAMIPLGALGTIREVNGPLVLTRYNMYPAAAINGNAAPGVSSGQAITIMEQLARQELLRSMSFEWTELAYLELQAGNTAMIVFGFAVVMVFLVMAAQFESWSLPLAVILVVPVCLLSAIAGVRLVSALASLPDSSLAQRLLALAGVSVAREDINIFTQIGFVVLVGLASKNAILIVEFAKKRRDAGVARVPAILHACELRLRPIIMTSLAFILGVVPLIVSHGAGAEMRHTLGTTVFSGMLGVTLFGIFLTPVFYLVIDWLAAALLSSSPLMRRINAISLDVVSLGHVQRLGRQLRRRAERVPTATPPAEPAPRPARTMPTPVGTAHPSGNPAALSGSEVLREAEAK